jgi:hypothetical protein
MRPAPPRCGPVTPATVGGTVGDVAPGWTVNRVITWLVVGEAGLEPAHPFGHRNLNPARLPIPPLARVTGQQ